MANSCIGHWPACPIYQNQHFQKNSKTEIVLYLFTRLIYISIYIWQGHLWYSAKQYDYQPKVPNIGHLMACPDISLSITSTNPFCSKAESYHEQQNTWSQSERCFLPVAVGSCSSEPTHATLSPTASVSAHCLWETTSCYFFCFWDKEKERRTPTLTRLNQ